MFAVGGGWRADEVAGRDWTREAGKRDHRRAEKSLGVTDCLTPKPQLISTASKETGSPLRSSKNILLEQV